ELHRFGVQTALVDCNDLGEVKRALQTPSRVLFVETISNPLLRVPDLERLAELAHDHECRFVVDNTFATPALVRPLDLGADLVMESLTKMIGGHRDAVNRFLRRAPGVPFSPSLGHTTTTCSHPATTSHRYVSPAEKQRQGITDGLVRLSVGVEEVEEIQREMVKGL